MSSTVGNRFLCPLRVSLHGTTPTALFHFDWIYLCLSHSGVKYVLLVRHDHKNFCCFSFSYTTHEIAARTLIDLCAAYGLPNCFMSNLLNYFRNETYCLFTKALHPPHNFSMPFITRSNHAIEGLGWQILRIVWTIISEIFKCDRIYGQKFFPYFNLYWKNLCRSIEHKTCPWSHFK